MSNINERPDFATRQVTSDDNKPKQPKELEKKMEELRIRLQMEKASELERQKEILQKNYEAELQRILHQKEKELKEARSETKRVKEDLTLQVRDAERRIVQTPPVFKEGVNRKLVTEVVDLKGVKRRLEEALGDVMDSDKRKACELRKLHDDHVAELGRFKRVAERDIRKLLAELKIKDGIIRQLKRELWVANERLARYQCQPQYPAKSKTGSQDDGNKNAANTHNLIASNSSFNTNFIFDKRNPNKRKHVSNSTQSSDVEDRDPHDADEPDAKCKVRKVLKTGQVPEIMYKRLYKEHLELQRSFALLRQMITDTRGDQSKCKNITKLSDENQRLQQISQHLKTKIQKLRNELKESRDQNELLEFCVLEMENQGKASLMPQLVERGVNTDMHSECLPIISGSTEYDALVEAYPHQELNEQEVKEIRKNLTYIYTAQGTNMSHKKTIVQATAHIQAAFTALSNQQNLVISLTKDIEAARKEKESHLHSSSEIKEKYEQCKKHLDETKKCLLDVSEQLASMQRREATLFHLEQINRKFKEQLQVVLQDLQVLLSDCADAQEMDVQNLRKKINELYKIEKEVILQAGILQALPNPSEVARKINVTSSKSLENSNSSEVDGNIDTQFQSNVNTVKELKLELQKQKLVTAEFAKQQKELLQNCNELSAKLIEYEAIKYDLTQKIVVLEKSEQDLVEKNLKLYIDYVSAKEEVHKLLVDLENKQVISSPTSPLELRNIVSIQCSDVQRTLSEESGTMTSEDEGLGEESRRGDSTGPSSLSDLQESIEDLITRTSYFECDASKEHKSNMETSQSSLLEVGLNKFAFIDECETIKFKWKKTVAELKEREKILVKKLKCSQIQLSKFHENIKAKEEHIQQLLGGGCLLGHNKNCEEEVQQVIKNIQKDLIELEEKLSLTEHSKNSLKEQVLELAENDARLSGHKLQEKLNLTIEQGNTGQRELECNNHLEESSKLQSHSATEVELQSQITYMEFLIHKYEDHINELETSKLKLQQRVFCLEQLLHSAEALTDGVDQQMIDKTEERTAENYSDCLNCGSTNKILESSSGLNKTQCPNNSQARLFPCKDILVKGSSLPINYSKLPSLTSRTIPLYIERANNAKHNSSVCFCSSLPSYLSINLTKRSNPVQKELVQRLNLLEKDDQTLREQLHQMDGMNLELWRKLHSLETHVGQCMKEYISELNENNLLTFPNPNDYNMSSCESPNSLPFHQQDNTLKLICQETESDKVPEIKSDHFTDGLIPSNTQNILSLETSEHKLKNRLIQLENINREFERQLEIRESLCKEKESQQRKWLEIENTFKETIRTLENEKSSLSNRVLRLEEEKLSLNKSIENLQLELKSLKREHLQALEELKIHRGKALNELEEKQNNIDALEKEKAEKIIELEQSVVDVFPPRILECSLEKYNILASELDMLRKDHAALRESAREHKDSIELLTKDFEKQFNAMTDLQKSEEEKLKLEIECLVSKEKEYNLQIIEALQKQTALENDLITKETELEQVKKQFLEQITLLEDEHRVVEAELKWKMKEIEENAAITIKALTEERNQLENELQIDLRDLHTKEESYKLRIAELEGCVENLRKEMNQIADADSEVDNEKLELPSESKLFLKQIEELQKNEKQMKAKLAEMEKKEEAYKETLEHAEKIISTLEHNYNDKTEELESSERALKLRVSQLEEVENHLRCTLHNEKRTSEIRKASDLIEELMEGETREVALRERITELEFNQKTLIEKLQEMERSRRYLQEELGDRDEMVRTIEKLQEQQEILKKELFTVQQSKNALQETLDHADDILIQREDELRQNLVRIENEKKELEEATTQLRKQVKELQTIEISQYGKVSPIGEHLYETLSNCDSEEEFQQSDETFYFPERTDVDVQKIKELEKMGNDLKQEVTHLKKSLSAANSHLIDLDNVNRNQQTTISRLEEEKSLLQQQAISSEKLEHKCKQLEKLCGEEERTTALLQQNLKELQDKEKWWEGLKDINSKLQEQVSLLQVQLSHPNSSNNSTAMQILNEASYTNNKEHYALNETENTTVYSIQEYKKTKTQNNSEQCDMKMDITSIVRNSEVQNLSKLCQTVLNNLRATYDLHSHVSDREDNECVVKIKEHHRNVIKSDNLLENDVSSIPEHGRHSPLLWSSVPGTVSLEDLTTGLEAQLELEQCVKRAMAAMEREIMQKETSQTPLGNSSISCTTTNVESMPSCKVLSQFVEHSSNVSSNSKGTITKCKTKILDVSELQQPHKSLSSASPHPPSNFRILRQVGDHSLLVGWSVPNEGCTIGGYQIYVDGQHYQNVRSPNRTKALLPKINVFQPVTISIYSISTSGHTSESVSVLHPGTLLKPEHPLSKKEMPYKCTTEHSCVLRIRTVHNEGYDVPVQKGSIVLVCSPPDSDGFCSVQVDGQEGKLPFSLLKEVKNVS